jgi:metal-responsive CopG/Arc/MetJ family transcriptional regulator
MSIHDIQMTSKNDKQFQMRVSEEFLETLDNWRRKQDDLPGRAEAIRRLVEQALDSPPKKKP